MASWTAALLLMLVAVAVGIRLPRRPWAAGVAVALFVLGFQHAAYYLHLYDRAEWYFAWRAWPPADLLPAAMGVLPGWLGRHGRGWAGAVGLGFIGALAVAGLVVPWCKPWWYPLDRSRLVDRWQGEVCLQTTVSTCGPACLATLCRRLGVPATEADLAVACRTSDSGTELWYLAREARSRGLSAHFHTGPDLPEGLAIVGTTRGQGGHFQALLGQERDTVLIGDPVSGLRRLPRGDAVARLRHAGMALVVGPPER